MIVGDEDAGHERDRHQLRAPAADALGLSGLRAALPLRLPRADLIASAPSTSSARSRMLRRPPRSVGAPTKPRPSSATRSTTLPRASSSAMTTRLAPVRGARCPSGSPARSGRSASSTSGFRFGTDAGNRRSTTMPVTRANRLRARISALTGQGAPASPGVARSRSAAPRRAHGGPPAAPRREPLRCSGASSRDRVQLQQDTGQDLPDLVVEIACDPDTLRFLGRERAPAAFLSFCFQPVEHAVEGHDNACRSRRRGRTCRRCPGRRRSTVSIRCGRRASGANAWRSSSALTAIVSTSPARTPIASEHRVGKLIVTGVTTSTIAMAVRRPALTAKTRQ